MRELMATITSKGQVTIPIEIRRHLGLEVGEKVAFVIEDEGGVRLALPRYPTIDSLRGAAGALKRPIPWKKVREIAREDRFFDE